MKIAIVGAGIAGLSAALKLHAEHDVHVFEANEHVGGHANTVTVDWEGKTYAIDTGFIVFNDRTYPTFKPLLDKLNVPYQPTQMGFSVSSSDKQFEYSGRSLRTVFAQKRRWLSMRYHRFVRDILRFNRIAPGLLKTDSTISLRDYFSEQGFGDDFQRRYIVPMGSAIWSMDPERMMDCPAPFFIRFFENHGLLSLQNRPQWFSVTGGSKRYVEALIEPFKHNIRTQTPVLGVQRAKTNVTVQTKQGAETFDRVVMACHPDQALACLAQPSDDEQSILGAMTYQENEVVLHHDERLLPKRRQCWSAWNYHLPEHPLKARVALTYNMNILQRLKATTTFCVSMNATEQIDSSKIFQAFRYAHPVITESSVAAQARLPDIQGQARTYYCGAYWKNGFHEDGCMSGMSAAALLNEQSYA